MTRINLLPWRETQREESKRQFFAGLGVSVVATALVLLIIHMMINGRINHQNERNGLLTREITTLDHKIRQIKALKKQKEVLLTRMVIIQDLQANRPLIVHVFESLVKMLPKGVHLKRVKRVNDLITLYGNAESNTNVSKLMRNIDQSSWLTKPVLSEIKTDKVNGKYVSEFILLMHHVHPKSKQKVAKHGS